MNEVVFWSIISLLNWSDSGDDELVIEPAIVALAKYTEQDIVQFEEILANKLYQLDTIAHARNIGEEGYVDENSYFSADWFLYSRCAVVANGQELYDSVLLQPKYFPKDIEFESLLLIGPEAYERKTGNDFVHSTKLSYETFSNKAGWQ
jgi:hypothetical protein